MASGIRLISNVKACLTNTFIVKGFTPAIGALSRYPASGHATFQISNVLTGYLQICDFLSVVYVYVRNQFAPDGIGSELIVILVMSFDLYKV